MDAQQLSECVDDSITNQLDELSGGEFQSLEELYDGYKQQEKMIKDLDLHILQTEMKEEETKMLHEVIAQYKVERDYEHTRFMEEQGKRSDLEREVEELKQSNLDLENMLGESYSKHDVFDLEEDIKTMSKCEELNLDLQKKMNEENEKLQEEVEKLKTENEWWGNIKDNLEGEKYELEKEIKKLKEQVKAIDKQDMSDDSSDFDDELVSVDCDVCGCHHSEYDRCGTNCN